MATAISTNSSGLSFTGLASGIDTSSIIDGLTKLNQQRVQDLQSQKAAVTLQQTTFSGIQAKLLDLQSRVGLLARSVGGAFDGRKAASSDSTVLTAAAGAAALPGTYSLQVQTLAQAQQLASSGVADPTATIKQGTVQIKVGNGTTTTVTIDATNNTLQGLAGAINNSGGDVRATVINDGSATPYRLLLSATKTGAANTIQVTNNLTVGDGAAPDLAQTTVQAASDARVIVGSGAGALTVASANNQVDNLVAGVSVNLIKAAPGQTVSLAVTNDTDSAHKALQDFVDSYNAVIDFIGQRNTYDAATSQAGVLLGNRDAANLENDLSQALGVSVGGINSRANRLTAIGITFTDDGHLQVDGTKLDQALNGQLPGVSASDFRQLFALSGTSSSSGVSFLLGGDRTQPSGATPYQVNATRAATAASVSATNALAASVILDSSNNAFTIKVNGATSSLLTLDPGTYTPDTLAAAVQAKINADTALGGSQVAVDLDGGRLRVRSLQLGSVSQVAFGSGSALGAGGPLGFTGGEASVGTNVAGQFLVNGRVEAATGFGQTLSGNSGNAHTDGLQVRVTLSADQIGAGVTSDLTVSQGLASRLSQVLNRYLDPVSGRFKTIDTGFQQQAKDIDQTITRQNDLLNQKKNELVQQFAAMETAISRLKSLGDQLTAQFGTTSPTTGK